MLEIDGAHGEGGGAIVRTAVALSAVTGTPCSITNIRAKRKNPGLQAQHVTAVDAVAKLCGAEITGNALHYTELTFLPHEIRGGSLSLNVGTAGSTALVLQALMIPAMHCTTPLMIKLTGGTLNKWAPSIGYLQHVTLPMLERMGYKGALKVLRHGFYPRGGGLVEAVITPAELAPLHATEPGSLVRITGACTLSRDLEKQQVGERMQKYARGEIFRELHVAPDIRVDYVDAASTGGGIELYAIYENTVLGSSALAERGKRAEDVAKEAVQELLGYVRSGACADKHLGDQLIPYLALARAGRSGMTVSDITEHARTNIWLCEKFLDAAFAVEGKRITCSF